MSKRDDPDVLTIIECERLAEGNYLLKIAKSPDTKPKPYPAYQWPENNFVRVITCATPAGVKVKVAVNFPDLLNNHALIDNALENYDEVQRRRLSGEWFDIANGSINTAWIK